MAGAHSAGVTHVEVSLPDGTIVAAYYDKAGIMESTLHCQNRSEYQRCGGPFMSGPLHNDVGYLGGIPQVQAILNSTYVTPLGLSEGAVHFIQQLRTPPSIIAQEGPMPNDISEDSYRYYWKKVKEQTSSGVAGLHFGHYKAGLWNETLCKLKHGQTNIPNQTSY